MIFKIVVLKKYREQKYKAEFEHLKMLILKYFTVKLLKSYCGCCADGIKIIQEVKWT